MNADVPLEDTKMYFTDGRSSSPMNRISGLSITQLAGSRIKALEEPVRSLLTESRAAPISPITDIRSAVGPNNRVYDDSIKATVTGCKKIKKKIADFTFAEMVSLQHV